MNTELILEPSTITITSKSKAPKKRTINECADILSSHGHLVNFEIPSANSARFFVEIKHGEISTLIQSLRRMEYLNENINSEIPEAKEPAKKPMLINISLNFLSN